MTVTLSAWYEKQAAVIFSTVEPSTVRGYRVAWRIRLEPTLGHFPLDELTTFEIETAAAVWTGVRSTKNDALALLSRLLTRAVRGGLIAGNPVPDVELGREPEADPLSRALSVHEVEKLLALVPAGEYRRFVAALAFTGMRFGEAAGLLAADVDLQRKVIWVRRQVTTGEHGETRHAAPKSKKTRAVPIIQQFTSYVYEAVDGKDSGALVFPGVRGGYMRYKTLARRLDWASLRTEVKTFPPGEPPLRFHDLRHSTATLLFDAGLSAPDVRAVLGHSSLQVTQRYAPARSDAAVRAAAALSAHCDEVKHQRFQGEIS